MHCLYVLVMNGFCPLGFPSRIWLSSPAGTGEQRAPSALVMDHFRASAAVRDDLSHLLVRSVSFRPSRWI
ncbi:hypothetical protein R1flu_014273 [Riccia fluitans]|uniref:Secreted protein n=1 Tax=Riccia fluitans TaxID=41844 RepID=A0ABD1YJE7_9MARC